MSDAFDFTNSILYINNLLQMEREAGRAVNGLQEIDVRRARHADIKQCWSQVKQQIQGVQDRVDALPFLPSQEIIQWAQNIQAMSSLAFLEVDTTNVGSDSEVVRIALSDGDGNIIFDQLIRPGRAQISLEASEHNGLTDADLEQEPMLQEIWPRIEHAVRGWYILSYNQEWDLKVLRAAAERHGLTPLTVIGECLQRRCHTYYHREYSLTLAKIAERMGHPLTSWDAVARLHAQRAIVDGLARGITDVSVSKPPKPQESITSSQGSVPDDELGLDDHPF